MSHFSVAVCAKEDDPALMEELLAPYSEVDQKYFQWMEDNEKTVDWYKKRFGNDYESRLIADGHKQINGLWFFHCNPNAKYDYYTLDGKDGYFEHNENVAQKLLGIKNGAEAPYFFQLRDYDLSYGLTPKEERVVRKEYRQLIVDGDGLYSAAYYKETYQNEDMYVEYERYGKNTPYAFVSPNGVWHAPGTVGWFAMDDSTGESYLAYAKEWHKFVEDNPELYVSFVDCHT